MKQWECIVCGWIYDEKIGDPDSGIEPGTKFEDIPDDWLCPECGVGKDDFELVEVPDGTPVSAPAANPVVDAVSVDPIIIVGTGLAGYGLLKEIRKLDSQVPVTLICKDDGRAYSKPALSTGYTKSTSADDLTQKDAAGMAVQYNASILTLTSVDQIDTAAQTLSINQGKGFLRYGKLVLALGAECITPPLEGDASELIYSINDLMDFAQFQQAVAAAKAKRICIMGAGLIGCEYANDLLNGQFEVESVDPMSTCLSTLLPDAAGQAVQRGLEAKGAQFHFGRTVAQLNAATDGMTVVLDDGSELSADIVLSAIGVRPRTELAEQAGIKTQRGICTDNLLQTSAANVFALGDCAEVEGLVMVFVAPLVAGVHALARTLTGTPTTVHYPAMPVAIKTPACPVVVSPPPIDCDGEWCIVKENDNSVLAEFENPQGEILGFALTGEYVGERSRLLQQLPDLLG